MDIKIGRVARSTERALGISLTGEVAIYAEESFINRLAEKRPDTYLSFVEEIGNILRNPDFVAFDVGKDELIYVKHYFLHQVFTQAYVVVARVGTPQRWFVKAIHNGGKLAPLAGLGGMNFVRPINKKVP